MSYTILTVNPGSTSTKIGLVKDEKIVLDLNVDTDPAEFAGCATIGEQAPIREKKIMEMLAEAGVAEQGVSPLLLPQYARHER